ncbi:hypothetical protein BJX99DRAFT_272830 [Aspergillus californicus]
MDLPSCALTCVSQVVSKSTCAITDFACICADPQINAQLQPCVLGACTVKEAFTAKNATNTACGLPSSDDTTVFPITNIVGLVVAILSVVVRVVNRLSDRRFGWDDYLIILSLLFAAAVSGIGLSLRDYGLGKDIWTVPFDDIRQTLKLFWVEELLYCICIALVKCSMLTLYLRVFPNPGLRIAVFVGLGATLVWGIVSFFVLLFSCKPIHYYWNEWDGEHEGTCISHNNILLAHSTINIVLDVGIIAIPMPTLFGLQMPLEKRLGVCVMFAVGIVSDGLQEDFVPVGIWSLLEFDVAIMCGCLPAIRSLCIRIYTKSIKQLSSLNTSQRLKNTSGASGSVNPQSQSKSQRFSAKAIPGEPDTTGQFIRLQEIETGDDRVPLQEGTARGHTATASTSGRGSLKRLKNHYNHDSHHYHHHHHQRQSGQYIHKGRTHPP